MIARKKEFSLGLGLLVAFFVVLFIFFSPVFNGHNGLDYLDNLYNSISKGSAYYIPKLKDDAKAFNGSAVEMSFAMASPAQAQQTAQLFMKAGAMVNVSEAKLKVSGDLGKILDNAWPMRTRCTRTTEKAWPPSTGTRSARHSTTGGRPSKGWRRT